MACCDGFTNVGINTANEIAALHLVKIGQCGHKGELIGFIGL